MKRLTERAEIASAINFKKYPVVTIDVSKRDAYGIIGCPVCVDAGFFRSGEPYYIKAMCRVYSDERVLTFTSGCVGLSADFGYRDIEEMLEYANVPIIRADAEVLVVIIDSEQRLACCPVIVRTEKRVNPHCSTPISFVEPFDFTDFFNKEEARNEVKYYATITHSTGQFEIGGTKESLTRDLVAMKRSGRLNGSESILIYGVDLETGNKVPAGDDGDEILKGGGW